MAAEFAIVGAPRSAIDARVAQGNRLARLVQIGAQGSAESGQVHRHGAARHHGGQSRARHVRRARARRWCIRPDRANVRTGVAALARLCQRRRDCRAHLLPHRDRRDGAEIARALARRANGDLDHAADVVDQDARLSADRGAERHGQRGPGSPRGKPPGAERRAVLHAGGAADDRPGERGAGRDSGGVRPDAAGALRVRRPDRRRGDGSARADHGRAGREHTRHRFGESWPSRRTRATRSSSRTSITSSA